jgi:hypothetical protein
MLHHLLYHSLAEYFDKLMSQQKLRAYRDHGVWRHKMVQRTWKVAYSMCTYNFLCDGSNVISFNVQRVSLLFKQERKQLEKCCCEWIWFDRTFFFKSVVRCATQLHFVLLFFTLAGWKTVKKTIPWCLSNCSSHAEADVCCWWAENKTYMGHIRKTRYCVWRRRFVKFLKTLSRGLHFDETYRPENQKKKRASCETLLFTDLWPRRGDGSKRWARILVNRIC